MLEKPKSLEDDMAEKEGDQAEGLREQFAEKEGDQAEGLREQFAVVTDRYVANEANRIPVTYLGDSVYARYENNMVGLTLNDNQNPVMIWLEPVVIEALHNFHRQCRSK